MGNSEKLFVQVLEVQLGLLAYLERRRRALKRNNATPNSANA